MKSLMNSDKKTRQNQGKFYTPQSVVDFCWLILRAWIKPEQLAEFHVVDPAAGDGIFLRKAYTEGWIHPERVLGVELYPDGVEEPPFPMIYGNGLVDHSEKGLERGGFDLVIGNPPFGGEGVRACLSDAEFEAELTSRYTAWQGMNGSKTLNSNEQTRRRLATCPVELLFFERFLMLCKEDGRCVIILPEGLLANARSRRLREVMNGEASVEAVISLPPGLFRGEGATARTAIVFIRKTPGLKKPIYLASPAFVQDSFELGNYLDDVADELLEKKSPQIGTWLNRNEWSAGRWDPGFWNPRFRSNHLPSDRTVPLGDFITFITYGSILPGHRPVPDLQGIRLIGQGQFAEAGLDLSSANRIIPGSEFDPVRSRVQQEDLLLPRSGEGSLLRFKVGVYRDEEPANVSCFVDLIRLSGIDPYYTWLVLKTRFLRDQILRLQNGVGTPNISFREIRSLQLPWLEPEQQLEWRRAYLEQVAPLQEKRAMEANPLRKAAWGSKADQAFIALVKMLEERIDAELLPESKSRRIQ